MTASRAAMIVAAACAALIVNSGVSAAYPADPSVIDTIVWEGTNPLHGGGDSHFGWDTSPVPDVDGDSYEDVIVGAPLEDVGDVHCAGAAILLSGKSGAVLQTLASPRPRRASQFSCSLAGADNFGVSVAGISDVDDDGSGDLVIGAPFDGPEGEREGRAYLFSGATGKLIRTFKPTKELFVSLFGQDVAVLPGFIRRGSADVAIGAPGVGYGEGRVYVFTSERRGPARVVSSPEEPLSGFGESVAALIGGSGRSDLLVRAAMTTESGEQRPGDIFRYDRGGLLTKRYNFPDGEDIAFSWDLAVSYPTAGRPEVLTVYATIGGTTALAFNEKSGRIRQQYLVRDTSAYELSVEAIDDFNGDGWPEIITANGSGCDVRLFEGRTGALIRQILLPGGKRPCRGVSVLPDINADGWNEFISSAYSENVFAIAGRGASNSSERAYGGMAGQLRKGSIKAGA